MKDRSTNRVNEHGYRDCVKTRGRVDRTRENSDRLLYVPRSRASILINRHATFTERPHGFLGTANLESKDCLSIVH